MNPYKIKFINNNFKTFKIVIRLLLLIVSYVTITAPNLVFFSINSREIQDYNYFSFFLPITY